MPGLSPPQTSGGTCTDTGGFSPCTSRQTQLAPVARTRSIVVSGSQPYLQGIPMRRRFAVKLAASLSIIALSGAALAAPPTGTPAPAQPAPLADLVAQVNIPYDSFTLSNGLRVLVHTDRKAPIVGVTTYYRVGSKNEPHG